jgi:hypothetical protein
MALTIATTTGSASANSYVSESDFKTWTDARLNVTAYQNATADQRQRALLMAFDRLQRESWIGDRVTETQAAAWPRINARKVDPVGLASTNMRWPTEVLIDVYETTEIPQAVKDAQCALALAYLGGFDEYADRLTSVSQDGLSYRKEYARPMNGLPGEVARLIGPLLRGGTLMRA